MQGCPPLTRAALLAPALLLLGLTACRDDGGTGPVGLARRAIAIQGGDNQIAAAGDVAPEPLQVVVSDRITEAPISDAVVVWTVVAGSGAVVSPSSTRTDASGVATAELRLGPGAGVYEVAASTAATPVRPVIFRARAVEHAPEITSIEPTAARAGDTISIHGAHFSPNPEENRVSIGLSRAHVVFASETLLRTVVPACLPTRTAQVVVRLGSLSSGSLPLDVDGDVSEPLDLAVGEARSYAAAGDLDCLVLRGDPGARYLVVPANASEVAGRSLSFVLVGLAGELLADLPDAEPWPWAPTAGEGTPQLDWERRIRGAERDIDPGSLIRPAPDPGSRDQAERGTPEVGEQREFSVYDGAGFVRVTAEVRHVSNRAVLYQDVRAPEGGFTNADFASFGAIFDDPIHPRMVTVYGHPSDIDGNGRVIVLFTPEVNRLTPRGTSGFVAGFFFGHDLSTGAGSNRGEIFYTVVPDPRGDFGDARTTATIHRVVPPVLAHEFQHMIHFNERVLIRGGSQESLWLSEALAHVAEDLVGDVLIARGQVERGEDFKASNITRARLYLLEPGLASLIAQSGRGSLEERGAGWLFLTYLMGHYGGVDLVRRLTQTTVSSVSNVREKTGRSWTSLMGDWSLALYLEVAQELEDGPLDPLHGFAGLDLRAAFQRFNVTYPLDPPIRLFGDFALAATLPAASANYLQLHSVMGGPPALNVRLTGASGVIAEADRPLLGIARLR